MISRPLFLSVIFGAVLTVSSATAQNEFHFTADDMLTGSTGNTVDLLCDNDIDVLGFSFAINYDESALELTDVSRVGTAAADADYYEGQLDDDNGYIGYGCVFDLDGDFSKQKLAPGSDNVLGVLTFTVLAASDTTTTLVLEDVAIAPNTESPVRNVLTNDQGQSVVPTLTNIEITIREESPSITDVTPGTGNAGDAVEITGEYFGHNGLTVTVCGVEANILASSDTTINIVVPLCPGRDTENSDCRDVVVSTERGSDTDTDGFCYDADPIIPVPVITSIDPTEGIAGTEVHVIGLNLNENGLSITMCGGGVQFDNLSATSVDVTVPGSCGEGPQLLTITTDHGSDDATFTVLVPLDTFVRGDTNSDGSIDLADGIGVLGHLFQGFPAPVCLDAADADNNGALELTDAVRIFAWLFTGGAVPPDPSPSSTGYPDTDCGPDPVEGGSLGCIERSGTCSS